MSNIAILPHCKMPRIPAFCYSHQVPPPRVVKFSSGDQCLDVDVLYTEEEHVGHLFEITQKAAEAGFNIGLDEYSTFTSFEEALDLGPSFTFVNCQSAKKEEMILGAFILCASQFQRSFRPHTCDIRIIMTEKLERLNGFSRILQVAEDMIKEMKDLYYDSAVVSIFATSSEYMVITRSQGYHPCAVLPQIGYVVGQKMAQDSVVFYKDIVDEIGIRPIEETQEISEKFHLSFNAVTDICKIALLPAVHTMKNGKIVNLRNCHDGEDEKLYDCLLEYARREEGYTMEDFPSIHILRGYYLKNNHVAVLEDAETEDVIGYLMIGESDYTRTDEKRVLADTSLVIKPKYQRGGFGVEFLSLGIGLIKDLGYKATMSDHLITNLPMYNLTGKMGYSKIGFSPKGAYIEGKGWVDAIYDHLFLETQKSFSELLQSPSKQ